MFNTTPISNPGQTIKKFFSPLLGNTGTLSAPQKSAAQSASEHFVAIGNILVEGGVSPEYMEAVGVQLLATKASVDAAILNGWAGGKNNSGAY